jgi:putative addiction module killer protein
MNSILLTEEAAQWIDGLDGRVAKARILTRIEQAKAGNFGDCEPVGEGVSEMRIHHGSGYRIYFTRVGNIVYVVLCGGTKGLISSGPGRLLKNCKSRGRRHHSPP